MKIKDLKKILESVDPELDIIGYTEDSNVLDDGMDFRVFSFEQTDISVQDVETTRLDDQLETPSLLFKKSEYSRKFALLHINSIF